MQIKNEQDQAVFLVQSALGMLLFAVLLYLGIGWMFPEYVEVYTCEVPVVDKFGHVEYLIEWQETPCVDLVPIWCPFYIYNGESYIESLELNYGSCPSPRTEYDVARWRGGTFTSSIYLVPLESGK